MFEEVKIGLSIQSYLHTKYEQKGHGKSYSKSQISWQKGLNSEITVWKNNNFTATWKIFRENKLVHNMVLNLTVDFT